MKKVLLLTTGGTIASGNSEDGLKPCIDGHELLSLLGHIEQNICVDVNNLMNLDSTNIQPEEWEKIAKTIYEFSTKYDGIVVTHGTDTMAYTASMLTFMLLGINIPVVLTGSQLPMLHPLSDANMNLRTALQMAVSEMPGIFVAFDWKVFLGCRTVKVRTSGFAAFESVNYLPVAQVKATGLIIDKNLIPKPKNEYSLRTEIENKVVLIKLTPATDIDLFIALKNMGIKGLVVEAFGAGGVQMYRRDLSSALGELVSAGIVVVVVSQCLYEESDITLYEVGRKVMKEGVISGKDMTSEAATTKLMWALGQTDNPDKAAELFKSNLAGEISE